MEFRCKRTPECGSSQGTRPYLAEIGHAYLFAPYISRPGPSSLSNSSFESPPAQLPSETSKFPNFLNLQCVSLLLSLSSPPASPLPPSSPARLSSLVRRVPPFDASSTVY